jgi:hypothetical protein
LSDLKDDTIDAFCFRCRRAGSIPQRVCRRSW